VALAKYVQRRKQKLIVKLLGSIEYDPTYDRKSAQWRKRSE